MHAKINLSFCTRAAAVRFGARTALAGALALGCIAAPGFASSGNGGGLVAREQAKAHKKIEKQLVAAEKAVAKAPRNAAARARLGQSYLAAGRFASAATTFEDAVSLGDQTPATALGRSLSYIALGRNAEGAAVLGQSRDVIPAGDYGLALALAGDPGQAVAILGTAIKQGENTPKVRQNLAYAYALAGYLAEARAIASQDVPLDQLDARVSDWALQASIGSHQSRVAALLGAPVRSDPGQPARLALAKVPGEPLLAQNPAPAVVEAPEGAEELPALAEQAPAPMQAQALELAATAPAEPQPVPAPAALASSPAPVEPFQEKAAADRRLVSTPAIQRIVARTEARQARAHPVATKAKRAAPKPAAVGTGSHHVQLGSFSSEEGARRAWDVFVRRDPSLKNHEMRITEAVVNGRRYWRVAAAGFDASSARAKCSSARGAGKDCFAYASGRALAGAVSSEASSRRLARR